MTYPPLECRHEKVSKDPILKGYFCTKCLQHFKRVPLRLVEPTCTMTFWQRLRWAVMPSSNAAVVPFVWTVAWGNARDRQVRPPMQPHWSNKPATRRFTGAHARKLYRP